LARLLGRLTEDAHTQIVDRYLLRDVQRAIESIEMLVRMHVAREEEIYEALQAV
jgi:DNA-binding SARP family transcriptional activator